MARKRNLKLKCPICKKPVTSQDADFPFCSERCRLIDLGAWFTEQHAIPGDAGPSSDDFHAIGHTEEDP